MAEKAAKHVWKDDQEFLLERSINTYFRKKGLLVDFADGDVLKQDQLWSRGSKKTVLAELVKEFRAAAQGSEHLGTSQITDAQFESKLDNMLKNSHYEWHEKRVRRTSACRQGKLNQRIAFAQHANRVQQVAQIREGGPIDQAAAQDRRRFWAELQRDSQSKSVELAQLHGRDFFATSEKTKELCGTQVVERSARLDLERYVRERDGGCISAILSDVPLHCIVCTEYSALHGELKVRQLHKFPREQERQKGFSYEKTSELDHLIPFHCGGLTTPGNVYQLCICCHNRKTQTEKLFGPDVLCKFFESFHGVFDGIIFEDESVKISAALRLTAQQWQRVEEYDRQIESGSVTSSYFPTQDAVTQLRAKSYFQDYYRKVGWVILNSAERAQKIGMLRTVKTLHDLVKVLAASVTSSSSSFGEPCLIDAPETPQKRKKPRIGNVAVIELSDSQED